MAPSQKIIASDAYSGKAKVQLKHLLLDVDFYEKPKIKALSFKFGRTAVGWLVEVYAQMSRGTDASVERDVLFAVAHDWQLENPEALVEYCCERGLIAERAKNHYSNSRVESDQEKCAEEREKARERKRRSRGEVATETLPSLTCPPSVTRDEREQNASGARTPVPVPVPVYIDPKDTVSPPVGDKFERWALDALEPPGGGAAWEQSNQFINCGRRPLRKYQNLFFAPNDLAEVFRQWSEAGVPPGRFRDGFQLIKATMESKPRAGPEPNCFKWAIGFIKKELLEALNSEAKLEKNKARE